MTLWDIHFAEWTDVFENLTPEEVLLEYDMPLTFTCFNRAGNKMLAHMLADSEGVYRFIVSPTNDAIIEQLKTGAISIRRALDQPIVWVADANVDTKVVNCWSMSIDSIPPDTLPKPDVLLLPDLEPLIRTYGTGETIHPGHIPADALRSMLNGVQSAIRKLTNFVTQNYAGGRPAEEHRQYYQLEIQELSFSSISVAFRRQISPHLPMVGESSEDDAVFARVEELLAKGLEGSQTGTLTGIDDDRTQEAIWNALADIAPGIGSPFAKIEVSGRIARRANISGKIHLTKMTRKLAGEHRKALQKNKPRPKFVASTGIVEEADKGNKSFELRQRLEDEDSWKFMFSDEQTDDVMDAFNGEYGVYVIGRPTETNNTFDLLEILDLDDFRNGASETDPITPS